MRVAVCVSGACVAEGGTAALLRNNRRLKDKFPGADFYYATWDTYDQAFLAAFPNDKRMVFPEPQPHYHPYLDVAPADYISPYYAKAVAWVRSGGYARIRWTSHHVKQILCHAWLSDCIRGNYDVIVRTRFDAYISRKADFAPYLQDTFENHRANCFGATRPRSFDIATEIDTKDGSLHGTWLLDHVIIHPADALDRNEVDRLYREKRLHAAEYGWYQVVSLPHGSNHRSHTGWANPDHSVMKEFMANNLIYQCWVGNLRSGVLASKANMEEYAARIGADYRFDHNPNTASKLCDVPFSYECLNPLLDDAFLAYDKVLSVDMDVFAVDGLQESIFDEPIGDLGICTEPQQPEFRAALSGQICKDKDEQWARIVKQRWGVDMPRNEKGLLKVYNTGVLVFSNAGMRKKLPPFQEYIDAVRQVGRFYTIDQNYLHAMMVKHLDYTELDNDWNRYVHYTGDAKIVPRPVNDSRTPTTKFVHIQLRGADDFDAAKLHRITNRPQQEWCL